MAIIQGADRALRGGGDVEENPGGVLLVRTSRGCASVLYRVSNRQLCGRHSGGSDRVVWRQKFGHPRGPHLLVACRARLCRKGTCCDFYLSRVTTRWQRAFELRLSLSFLGVIPLSCVSSLCYIVSHGSRQAISLLSTNENICRLLLRPSSERSRAAGCATTTAKSPAGSNSVLPSPGWVGILPVRG